MDLWVTEPSGEKAFYGHKETVDRRSLRPGLHARLRPRGYFVKKAMKGPFKIQVNYSATEQILAGDTTIQATRGPELRPSEERQEVTRRLKGNEEVLDIAGHRVREVTSTLLGERDAETEGRCTRAPRPCTATRGAVLGGSRKQPPRVTWNLRPSTDRKGSSRGERAKRSRRSRPGTTRRRSRSCPGRPRATLRPGTLPPASASRSRRRSPRRSRLPGSPEIRLVREVPDAGRGRARRHVAPGVKTRAPRDRVPGGGSSD